MGVENVDYHSVAEKDSKDSQPTPAAPKGFGARHVQALILFISITGMFSMRAQLSVTMVAMTSSNISDAIDLCNDVDKENYVNNGSSVDHNKTEDNKTTANELYVGNCTEHQRTILSTWSPYRTYKWNKSTQEMILFSFFVGYTSMTFPMGIIAQKYGGKLPILVALAVNGVVSLLTPWIPIFTGWIGVCVCRLLQGLTQAALFPSIHTILGKWAPICERGRLSTYIYSGSQFGTILIFQVSGVLAGNPTFGWPSIFWLCGCVSLCCFCLVAWLGAASPQDCASISSEELLYIMGDGIADLSSKKRKTPWKQILASTAVWASVVSHIGSAMGYILVLVQTPTYMSKVLNVDIKRNGLYSSLPYLAMYVMTLFFGWLSDMLRAKNIMSIRNIRRTANTIGMVVSGVFLVVFGFVQSTGLAVVMLIISVGLHSGVHVGFHINQIDLAPNYAGPLMGMGNMMANLMSLLVPVMVTNIIQDDTNQRRWQILFIIIAVIQIVSNLLFVIFVKAEVQDWNYYGDDDIDEKHPLKERSTSLFEEKDTSNGKAKNES
ncbi:hypothetical protein ABMA27_016881 [Loxostege sticticalis]|uniref:Major facilitator superfamily (MFS) profile domain-containing protein n=1 Tax=Loxostege sticticalis TaxID=481309 RepID=A0ABR3I3X0_LOXSC